ncbi:hypothetical protein HK104_002092 [Borealophlyctis nickersoniae]|nr:hypothetical protein HK104_002092 [Borealophlyctis nickersoniae]
MPVYCFQTTDNVHGTLATSSTLNNDLAKLVASTVFPDLARIDFQLTVQEGGNDKEPSILITTTEAVDFSKRNKSDPSMNRGGSESNDTSGKESPVTPEEGDGVAQISERLKNIDFRGFRQAFQKSLRSIGLCVYLDATLCDKMEPHATSSECTPKRLMGGTAHNRKKDGSLAWTPAYDVKNAFMVDAALHKSFDRFEWSIVKINHEFQTFSFIDGVVPKTRILQPAKLPTDAYSDYYVKQFPHERTFQEHFCQGVVRRFRAAGENPEDPFGDFEQSDLVVEEGNEEEFELFEKVPQARSSSNETLVNENF